jgi:ribosomal-protein-alanine N-acetyltransferase
VSGDEALSHAQACSRLHSAAFAPSGARGWSEAEFKELLGRDTVTLIMTNDAALVFETVLDEAEVLTIAVAPDAQRQGKGTALLDALLSQCRALDVKRCFLEVAVDNEAAVKLYRRYEFSQIGMRRGYFQRGDKSIHALVMERLLP